MRYETPVLAHPTRRYETPMLVDLAEVSGTHEPGFVGRGCDGLCLTGGGTGTIEPDEPVAT